MMSHFYSTHKMSKKHYQSRFIFRHMSRQGVKTLLAAAIAVFFMFALGYLQTSIERTESEVDYMYSTTIVTGEVAQANSWDSAPGRFHNNVIRPQTIKDITPFVGNELIEACHEFAVLVAANEVGSLPENWDEIAGININAFLTDNIQYFNTLVGINNLERYARINSPGTGDDFSTFSWEPSENLSWVANWQDFSDLDFMGMQINFAQGFDLDDFKMTENNPIPVILNNRVMGLNGFELGDIIYVSTSTMLRSWEWNHTPAVIVGTYNLSRLTHDIFQGVLMPVDALVHIVGDELRYISMQFEIDPVYNREIDHVRNEIEEITEHITAGEVPLGLSLDDEELRMVVIPMEQNLSLLRLLYPVAIVLSAIIGLGLSMLLMQQNAKTAAIMRVMGTSSKKARITLCSEQMIVVLLGLAIGIAALIVLGWGFGFTSSLFLAGVYFAGTAAGTIIGVIVVTNRPPLNLLQVKE